MDILKFYGIDATGNVIPIVNPGAVQQGNMATMAADSQKLGGLLPEEFAKVGETGVHMELLWENASPESDFTAQTIAVDLNAYSHFLVLAFELKNKHSIVPNTLVPVGSSGCSFRCEPSTGDPNGIYANLRRFSSTKTGVSFEAGISAWTLAGISPTAAESNNAIVPHRIYGIKGVS